MRSASCLLKWRKTMNPLRGNLKMLLLTVRATCDLLRRGYGIIGP